MFDGLDTLIVYVQSYVNFAISENWASCGRKNVT